MIKGKKDHVFHNTCLDYIINFYDGESKRAGLEKILINILHIENFAGQYKCRFNFLKLITFPDRHPGTCAQHKFTRSISLKALGMQLEKLLKTPLKTARKDISGAQMQWILMKT